MLRSLIHLDLTFVQGNKYVSIFILLHTDHQLDYLLKMLSLFYSMVFAFFTKNQVSISVWGYSWVFDSILLINLSVSVPTPCCIYHYCFIVQLRSEVVIFPLEDLLLFRLVSAILGFLFFHMKLRITLSMSEELCENFDGDCIDSVDCFW